MPSLYDENKRLEFTFDACQKVFQYDTMRFYRNKIEKNISGICAVDFLCHDSRRKESFLIEVKDFSQLEGDEAKQHKGNQTAENWAVTVARKVLSTIAGLYVASFSAQCDDDEKTFAKHFLESPLRIVFHYELPQKWSAELRKNRMADMKMKLKNKLGIIDPSVRVEDLSMAKYWHVKRLDS